MNAPAPVQWPHALQLTAAQLLWQALAQALQTYGIEHFLYALLALAVHAAQQHQRQGNVLRHIEVWQNVKSLKHKAQMRPAPDGTLCFIQVLKGPRPGATHGHAASCPARPDS